MAVDAKRFLDILERDWEYSFKELMGGSPQCILGLPPIQLLRPFAPVPYGAIQVANHDHTGRQNAVCLRLILTSARLFCIHGSFRQDFSKGFRDYLMPVT